MPIVPKAKVKWRFKMPEHDGDPDFRPSPSMMVYCIARKELGMNVTDAEICRQTGITHPCVSAWKRNPKFQAWMDENLAFIFKPVREQLEVVALLHIENFRFWEALAKRYGYITDQPAVNADELTAEQIKERDKYIEYLKQRQ